MTDELLKLLLGTGVGGILAVAVYLDMRTGRKEAAAAREADRLAREAQAAELRTELRENMAELRGSLENLPGHLQAIHSRLGSLGADSVPPPVAEPRRRKRPPERLPRLQTAPTGVPVPKPIDDEEPG